MRIENNGDRTYALSNASLLFLAELLAAIVGGQNQIGITDDQLKHLQTALVSTRQRE